jgi:hypothetical protein
MLSLGVATNPDAVVAGSQVRNAPPTSDVPAA